MTNSGLLLFPFLFIFYNASGIDEENAQDAQ